MRMNYSEGGRLRALDGIKIAQSQKLAEARKTNQPSLKRNWRAKIWLGVLVFLIGMGFVGGLWAQPILAALPFDSWSDRLSLIKTLRPGSYLILFQNQRELRPTGGFLGSFARVELDWGWQIKSLKVETNIYARDGKYGEFLKIDPPEPFKELLADAPWTMHDSNWALDFREAAQTIAWFFEQEGGEPVDGVIAIDGRLLERLMLLTGSISVEAIDEPLSAETVLDQLQEAIEKDYWADVANRLENEPKSVLAELAPKLISRLKFIDPKLLLKEFATAFEDKEVMVYVRDSALAEVFYRANWDGHIVPSTGDYFYLNEANLTSVDAWSRVVGAKSSWSIRQSVRLERTAETHNLTINRRHEGKMVWPDGPNESFLRLALPSGSTLFSVKRDGQDITGEVRLSLEADKTVIGFWSRLQPGESQKIELIYQTPVVSNQITIQRQPGAPAYLMEVWDNSTLRSSGLLRTDFSL